LISVVVVNWNRQALLRACLASLARQAGVAFETIVVDNGSTDGSAEMAEREFGALVLRNRENRGFCAANNQGIAAARGEYIALLNNDAEAEAGWLDGLLAGYVLLAPKDGLEYLAGIIKDAKTDFLVRYAALRSLRFFWEYREDVLKKPDIVAAIQPLLDQPDIVDLAVEDLRKWERWDLAPKVVGLFEKPSHEASIIQRSIIKYALSAPANNEVCAKFVAKLRADEKQAERVRDLEQLLELEKPRPADKKDPKK